MMKLYKGDIVHKKNYNKNIEYIAKELHGMLEDTSTEHLVLWYRPLKNKIKHSIYKLRKWIKDILL